MLGPDLAARNTGIAPKDPKTVSAPSSSKRGFSAAKGTTKRPRFSSPTHSEDYFEPSSICHRPRNSISSKEVPIDADEVDELESDKSVPKRQSHSKIIKSSKLRDVRATRSSRRSSSGTEGGFLLANIPHSFNLKIENTKSKTLVIEKQESTVESVNEDDHSALKIVQPENSDSDNTNESQSASIAEQDHNIPIAKKLAVVEIKRYESSHKGNQSELNKMQAKDSVGKSESNEIHSDSTEEQEPPKRITRRLESVEIRVARPNHRSRHSERSLAGRRPISYKEVYVIDSDEDFPMYNERDYSDVHHRSARVNDNDDRVVKYELRKSHRHRQTGTPIIEISRGISRNSRNRSKSNESLINDEVDRHPTPTLRRQQDPMGEPDKQDQSMAESEHEESDDDEVSAPVVERNVGDRHLRATKRISYARKRLNRSFNMSDNESDVPCTSRELRKKDQVNYTMQLMPPNLHQILDKEARDRLDSEDLERQRRYNRSSVHQRPSSPNNGRARLNEEDDDEPQPLPRGRIFGLFGNVNSLKGTNLPLNMAQIMKAEKARLLDGVDEETKALFLSQKPLKTADASSFESVDFSYVAGLDERNLYNNDRYKVAKGNGWYTHHVS